MATRLEDQLGPLEFVFLRYAFAFSAIVAVWRWLPGEMPKGRDFWRTALMGVLVFTVGHLFQILGMQRSQASDAAVVLALDPLVSSIGAAWFLHERIPRRRWLGFVLAIGGVTTMSLWQGGTHLPGLLANLLIVVSFVTEAVWSVMGKPLIERWGVPKVTALALGAGTLVNTLLLIPGASEHAARLSALSAEGWFSLAFLGIVLTAVGYSVWFVVIREVPVSVAAMTIYLQPVLATVLATLLTGERLHAGHALGSGIILAGVVLGIRRTEK